jgi:catechol 2,3-dioxygenase-like lactoylglutathione lyase family enzyme
VSATVNAVHAVYAHTCIVALDWRRLATFYERVFGCERLDPERYNCGEWVDRLTGLRNVRVSGVHLRLPVPNANPSGPTLEILQFDEPADRVPARIHRPGLAHLAFRVDDILKARDGVLAHGGSEVGELVTAEIAGAGTAQLVYLADPEGNIVELQQWA